MPKIVSSLVKMIFIPTKYYYLCYPLRQLGTLWRKKHTLRITCYKFVLLDINRYIFQNEYLYFINVNLIELFDTSTVGSIQFLHLLLEIPCETVENTKCASISRYKSLKRVIQPACTGRTITSCHVVFHSTKQITSVTRYSSTCWGEVKLVFTWYASIKQGIYIGFLLWNYRQEMWRNALTFIHHPTVSIYTYHLRYAEIWF